MRPIEPATGAARRRATFTGCALIAAVLIAAALLAAITPTRAADTARNQRIDDSVVFSAREDRVQGVPSAMKYDARLPSMFDTKLGVDFPAAATSIAPDPDRLIAAPGNGNTGSAWATLALPAAPLGLDRAALDARLDSAQDSGKLGVALSRKLPINDNLALTVKNSYGVTGTLPAPQAGTASVGAAMTQSWETRRTLRLDLPQSSTAFSAGEQLSTTDEKWLRSFSAEQKIYGPLSVTGTVSETPDGTLDKVIKAGFKKTW